MFTEQEIKTMYQKHSEGISIRCIAKNKGVHRATVDKYFKKYNLEVITKQDIYQSKSKQIVSLYMSGRSINDISKKLHIPSTGVYRVLKKHNVVFKKQSHYRDKFTIYNVDEDFFKQINTPESAYILGFLYADGNVHSKLNQIKLKLQESDKYILNDIKSKLKYSGPLHFYKKKKDTHQNQYSLVISNPKIHRDLCKWGVVPNKTFHLKFPQFLDNFLLSHFVRGYFDGDGCFYIDYKRNSAEWSMISTTSFCNSFKNILMDEFQIKSVIQHDNRWSSGIDRIRVRRKKDIINLCKWMYNDAGMFLHRKKNKFLEFRSMNDHI